MRVNIFGRKDCGACKSALNKMEYFSRKWGRLEDTSIEFIDMDTPDGLAEGAWRDVYDVPTVILEDEGGELARWVRQVPVSRDFKKYFLREALDEESRDQGIH
jgi:thiol-disulfide isomerase/thioredoxin